MLVNIIPSMCETGDSQCKQRHRSKKEYATLLLEINFLGKIPLKPEELSPELDGSERKARGKCR